MIFHFHQELFPQFASTYAVSKSKVNTWEYFRDGGRILPKEFLRQRKSIKLQNKRGQKPSLGFDLVAVRVVSDQLFLNVQYRCLISVA